MCSIVSIVVKKNDIMVKDLNKTTERLVPGNFTSKEEYILYLRHMVAYHLAKEKIAPGCHVLEAGTGEGYGASFLSLAGLKMTGLDIDQPAVEHANAKYGSENCHYLLYGGSKMPFEDLTFDAVISFQVIEHIMEDRNYISEIHRVLKPGGSLMINTPNRTNRLKPGQKPFNPFHVREYASSEFEEVLKSSFQEVKVLGIRGKDEVQKIELNRVKLGSGLISFDRFNLRKLIPSSIKRQIIRLLKAIRSGGEGIPGDHDFMTRYSVEDFYVIEENVDESLDLFAILKK